MLISMFNIPLVHLKVNNWHEKKIKLVSLMESQKNNFQNRSNLHTTFHNTINSDKVSELNLNIHQILNEEIFEFMNIFKIDLCKISESWFQVQEKFMCHPAHNHHCGFAAVCYLQYDKEKHTPVEFIAPYLDLFDGKMLKYIPENIDEGSIVFFPASLVHQTLPNMSEYERIVLAFNLIQVESK